MAGDLAYFWIPVPDAGRARAFYGGLLGWEFAPGCRDDQGTSFYLFAPAGGD